MQNPPAPSHGLEGRQQSGMTVLFLTKDLFFIPPLKSALTAGGMELRVAPSVASPKLAELDHEAVAVCVIDLSGLPAAEVGGAVQSLRERFRQAQVVAFGPHVQEQRLEAARQAGCDQVLSRGQLTQQIGRLVESWKQLTSN